MPRRILLLITDLEIGGTPTVVRELATRLHRPDQGVHVEVACLSKWGPVADQIRSAGVEVTALGASRVFHFPAVAWRLRRLVRRRHFDTVFSFLIHANAVAALASVGLGGVRFLQSIQTTQSRPLWHWWIQGLIQTRAESIVVPSASVSWFAQSESIIPARRFVVIPNAVDPAAFAVEHPADGHPFPIGFLGRLDPIKRVPNLVEAVHRLNGLVHLHVFGQGRERARIERRIAELDAGAHVTMHGAVPRAQDALRHMGLLVLPSDAEGFGLVLIEAMAAGVPVVATKTRGIVDVVDDGRTGLLVGNDPHSLSRVIQAMVRKPFLRERLARAGREEVLRRFTWDVVMPQYEALLRLT